MLLLQRVVSQADIIAKQASILKTAEYAEEPRTHTHRPLKCENGMGNYYPFTVLIRPLVGFSNDMREKVAVL